VRKLERRQILRNVSSNWIMLGINVLVGIFLSPFILHRLGDTAFGIWVLIFSITGYYGIFDLGIRASVVRYVSRALATNDRAELASVVNTSLFSYSCVGLFTLLLTLILSASVDHLFRISPGYHATARWLMLMVGTSVALGFPLGLTGSLLEGLQRFDIQNGTAIVAILVRAGLTVLVLYQGRGLLTVALITVVVPLITSMVRAVMVLRICPIPFAWRYVRRATFGSMLNYGGITFLIIIAGRLKFKTDEIIIGSMMSAAAITYFNIGARIVDYAGEFVVGLAQIFLPMSSRSDATGNIEELRRIFIVGNRFCAIVMFPICCVLIILGKSVIEVWVGRKYVAYSYPVLVIMILCTTVMWSQGASSRILMGMGRHGTLAIATLIEGITNVVLSVLLVRPYGIVGDALGTAIPMVCSMLFFLPGHLCRRLGLRIQTYLRQSYALPFALCIPLVMTMLLMQRWFVPHTFLQLTVHLAVAGLVYGAGIAWAYFRNWLTTYSAPLIASSFELSGAAAAD